MRGAARSTSTSKPYLALLDVVKLVQQPLGDAATATKITTGICDALSREYDSPSLDGQVLHKKAAAQLSSCVAAALQCAGWLVASQPPTAAEQAPHVWAISLCVWFATRGLMAQPLQDVSLLRAVLLPAAGHRVPGESSAALLRVQHHHLSSRASSAAAMTLTCKRSHSCLGSSQEGDGTEPVAHEAPLLCQLSPGSDHCCHALSASRCMLCCA
jgi:hypothetical protein